MTAVRATELIAKAKRNFQLHAVVTGFVANFIGLSGASERSELPAPRI